MVKDAVDALVERAGAVHDLGDRALSRIVALPCS